MAKIGGCLKGKKLTKPDFLGKNLILEINAQKHPKNRFLVDFAKKKRLLMCRLFEFKSCTIMNVMILLKLHIWEKSGSRAKCKNALSQLD